MFGEFFGGPGAVKSGYQIAKEDRLQLVLDLGLHVVNGVAGLHVERDRLAREGLHENLHTAAETKHEVERRFLLDVVIAQRPPVLELLPSEDQALLVGRNPFLVLLGPAYFSYSLWGARGPE